MAQEPQNNLPTPINNQKPSPQGEEKPEPQGKEKTVIRQITEFRSERFSGPLPHPAILQAYDKVVPGAADRIIKMAEEQGKHRMELEKVVVILISFQNETNYAIMPATPRS